MYVDMGFGKDLRPGWDTFSSSKLKQKGKYVTFSNGDRIFQKRSQRYQTGHFLPSELDFAHRMFNRLHYRTSMVKYDDEEKDIEPVLKDVVETFNDLVKGKIRLQPQKFPERPED